MAVRLTCTDNASGHDGLRWRMGEDSESVDIVIGETAPGVGELVVSDPITPEACFSVVAYAGSEESEAAGVCADTGPEDYNLAQIGDEIGGGIYAGIDTIDGTDYHIIAGVSESEVYGLRWKVSASNTDGTESESDGLGNTLAMEAAGLSDHPAAAHCLAYAGGGHSDWHMPARNQATLIYDNLAGHPEFEENVSSNDYTWTSSRGGAGRARVRRLSNGDEVSALNDSTTRRVRPIRRVQA